MARTDRASRCARDAARVLVGHGHAPGPRHRARLDRPGGLRRADPAAGARSAVGGPGPAERPRRPRPGAPAPGAGEPALRLAGAAALRRAGAGHPVSGADGPDVSRPVVLASHRGPVTFGRANGERTARRGAGGLVTALMDLARQLDD